MITPDLDKIKATLGKIKKLAEGGIGGEKDAAQRKLLLLCKKYEVELSELDTENRIERDLKHHKDPDARDILIQVIVSIRDTKLFVTKSKCIVHAKLTTKEYIEAIEKYKYYWDLYKTQKSYFKSAFITLNGLYASKGDKNYSQSVSEEAKQEIACMQAAMREGNFNSNKTSLIEQKT